MSERVPLAPAPPVKVYVGVDKPASRFHAEAVGVGALTRHARSRVTRTVS